MNQENQKEICTECGVVVSAEDKFCGNCGATIIHTEKILEEIMALSFSKLKIAKDTDIKSIKARITEVAKIEFSDANLSRILQILKELPSCPKCGIRVSSIDKFCNNCGTEIVLEQQTEISSKKIVGTEDKNGFLYFFEVFEKYAIFSGRSRRKEYWYFFLFNAIISTVLSLIYPPLGAIYLLVALIPGVAVAIRRLHDINRSGWWLLISIIPFIGTIPFIIFMAKDGDSKKNQYGPGPKEV